MHGHRVSLPCFLQPRTVPVMQSRVKTVCRPCPLLAILMLARFTDVSNSSPPLKPALMPLGHLVPCRAPLCTACLRTHFLDSLSQGSKAAASVPRHAAPPPARAADDWAAAEAWSEWDAAPGCRARDPEQPRGGQGRPHDPAGPPAANTRACVAHAQDAGKARRACGFSAGRESSAAARAMWRMQKLGQVASLQYAGRQRQHVNKPGSDLTALYRCAYQAGLRLLRCGFAGLSSGHAARKTRRLERPRALPSLGAVRCSSQQRLRPPQSWRALALPRRSTSSSGEQAQLSRPSSITSSHMLCVHAN